jgi:hypothetical protein
LTEDAVTHTHLAGAAAIGLIFMAVPISPNAFGSPGQASNAGAQKSMLTIPQSLQTEHEEIHEALTNATRAPGRVGAAAKELAAVLHPHFEPENQIALPPHARTEEEVLYPAAILVGDIIRARMAKK